MSVAPVPRRSLLWLFGGLAAALLPHMGRLPFWVVVVFAVSIAWRLRVHQGRWAFPSWPVRALLVVMACAAVALAYRSLLGLEPAVALLAIAASLKTIELKIQRDFLVVVFAAYFLTASQLLFSQEPYDALYALLGVLVVTAALVARHQGDAADGFPGPLGLATRMLAQAVPLMLILFLVFPRLAPLWSIPQNTARAKTGPADSMSPGDFARLSGSSELAFRVSFDGPAPRQSERYWRGLVFSEFDGREWQPGGWSRFENELARSGARRPATRHAEVLPGGVEFDYEVVLEPSNQPWVYVLGYPTAFDGSLRRGSDFRLMTSLPITQRFRYRVRSDLAATLEPELGLLARRAELQLPDGFNPRSIALAREWRAAAASDGEFIDRVLRWFNEENFIYTLEPGLLGRDTVDEFLFGARRGFCEHYASSFVVLLRAAGIPARVVAGYQGGEANPFEDYLLVHQYDAHAWTEAWLPGRGWVRFDPTAAVAPQRIESGLEGAVGADFLADSPLALERYRGVALLGWLRMRWDLVNYQWVRLVLQFDSERQASLLGAMLGKLTPARLGIALLACGGTVLALIALSLFGLSRQRRRDPATELYLSACDAAGRAGTARNPGEGPLSFAERFARERPELAGAMHELSARYVELVYARGQGRAPTDIELRSLRDAVRRFRLRRLARAGG